MEIKERDGREGRRCEGVEERVIELGRREGTRRKREERREGTVWQGKKGKEKTTWKRKRKEGKRDSKGRKWGKRGKRDGKGKKRRKGESGMTMEDEWKKKRAGWKWNRR